MARVKATDEVGSGSGLGYNSAWVTEYYCIRTGLGLQVRLVRPRFKVWLVKLWIWLRIAVEVQLSFIA